MNLSACEKVYDKLRYLLNNFRDELINSVISSAMGDDGQEGHFKKRGRHRKEPLSLPFVPEAEEVQDVDDGPKFEQLDLFGA